MKNVLITGGTKGLGKALALELGTAGYSVLALFRADEKAAARAREDFVAAQITAQVIRQDLTLPTAGPTLQKAISESEGQWNVLHCATAPFEPRPLRLTSWESMIELFATSVWGLELCTRLLFPKFAEKGGAIVSILSDLVRKPQIGYAAQAASQQALAGWSQSAARELSALSVKVFTVSPEENFADAQTVARRIRTRLEDPNLAGMGEDYRV